MEFDPYIALSALAVTIVKDAAAAAWRAFRDRAKQRALNELAARNLPRELDRLQAGMRDMVQAFEPPSQPVAESTTIVDRDGTEEWSKPFAGIKREDK